MKKKKAIETLIHWIGFTLKPERTVTKEDVIRMLGMDDRYCGQNVSGRQGYRRQYYLKGTGITILTDGKRGMGIHVDIPGESIAALRNTICAKYQQTEATWLAFFLKLVLDSGGSFTRIDLALDDIGGGHFRMDELHRYQDRNQIVAKFRKVSTQVSKKNRKSAGSAITFGNRKGAVFVRIYDKQEEEENNPDTELAERHPSGTVRWEFEFKKKRANSIAEKLIRTQGNVSVMVQGLLKYYFRIIRRDNKNVSRCTVLKRWKELVADAQDVQLKEEKANFNFEHQLHYVRNALPAVAVICQMLSQDQRCLEKLFRMYLGRASEDLLEYAATHQTAMDRKQIRDYLQGDSDLFCGTFSDEVPMQLPRSDGDER